MEGYLYTLILFSGVLLVALIAGKCHASEMMVRKIIHMGVGNWWFLEMRFFPTMGKALVLPCLFIVLNALYVVFHKGESEQRRNYGLVYYPISLVILVLLQFKAGLPQSACLTGVLCMAYGDSIAAILGRTWGKRRLPGFMHEKTMLGFVSMFVVSFAIIFMIDGNPVVALIIGLGASVCEAVTPYGLDNLTVPILTALAMGGM